MTTNGTRSPAATSNRACTVPAPVSTSTGTGASMLTASGPATAVSVLGGALRTMPVRVSQGTTLP
ncbi:hypothetical protein [Isoptericola variabilis]|uniref:hypothetical protein n=1 Tax=Isoptericola variabilis TaxID=139208 RepID=UPI0011AD24A2|nr:hypothetical protein L600_000400000950 [Isoptericola variabilis J7]